MVTPSLNKSFKFQSDWPYNNSQIYLLNSIMEDIEEDEDREFKTTDDGYYFSSSVNYPNNEALVNQNVYVNKNGEITKVEVTDTDGNVQILMNFNKIEFDKKFDNNYFEIGNLINMTDNDDDTSSGDADTDKTDSSLSNSDSESDDTEESSSSSASDSSNEENTSSSEESNSKQTATIDDIVYPMYLPDNTYLTSQERVDTENGERLILTFDGDSSFILVEETIQYENEGLIIPVSGEFDFLTDVIGVISNNSLTWESNDTQYYMVSDTLEVSELVSIARSISVLPVSK